MSGICGICQPGNVISREMMNSMVAALARGDEQREAVAGDHIALGAARRWPNQQVFSAPGLQLAINTDLVATAELEQLIARSGCDVHALAQAELLARAYSLYGMKFLDALTGAFAIAIWDEPAQRLVLAGDRFGIHPLYWNLDRGRLCFASRPSPITAVHRSASELNPDAVAQFLIYSAIPAPFSVYRTIERLRPGHYLVFERGTCREFCYWDMQYREEEGRGERYWAEQLREHMRDAVRRHLPERGDAVGAYLSGGTDSSSVVAFMNEQRSPVNTFSIYFADARYSEVSFARTTAEHFKTRHFEKALTPLDALQAIETVADYYDEPFANSSAIGGYYCALLAKQNGVDTLLGGDGGDELFAGNERYASDKQFQIYQALPLWFRRILIEPVAKALPGEGLLSLPRRYINRANIPNPDRLLSYSLFLSTPPAEVFESDFLAELSPETWLNVARQHFSRHYTTELNRLLYLDVKMTLGDNDIPKVTGTAEIAGVRARYPLLDHRLADFSGQVPSGLKLKGFKKRYIFKRAMKGILPDKVLFKKKHGFGVPIASWFLQDSSLNNFMREVLCDPGTRQRGIFRPAFLDQLMDQHRREHAIYYGEVIWYLLVLELWQRRQSALTRELAIAH